MKKIVVGLCVVLAVHYGFCAMSEKQINATKKLVRNTCMNKANVAPEIVDAMHKGDFSQGQCYISCIMNTYKLISPEGTFDWEGGIRTMEANAPKSLVATASVSIKKCKDAMKTSVKSNKCQGAAEIAQCIYEDNPPNYFFP
ncbi:general odorant-binding protein 72-like [Diabrotica virgifera virgifera]|uniref:General odorant-binding protein 72-like n=1 Tax=Diabrotica virgifera virgifera TaxID=50390 RepID=A0A6P7FQH1_DIAVI|nr:general odorant-binding protein 72-like [Diabrotica virgifera virgifera]